jgi:hypothetical protein
MTVKKLSSFLFVILLSALINSASGHMLKGNVVSCKDVYYSVRDQFGKITAGSPLKDSLYHDQSLTFDQKGNVTELTEYFYDGTVYCKFKGSSAYADNHMETVFVRFDPGPVAERLPFIIESVRYGSGEMCDMTYVNDSAGRPVEESISDLMGNIVYKISFKRDKYGNILSDQFSNGTTDIYKYDPKGTCRELITTPANIKPTVTSFNYDETGNLIERNVNNYFQSTFKYRYDILTYKYAFDKTGNWKQRIEYENGEPRRMVIRTIRYSR